MRAGFGGERYEREEHQTRVREIFAQLRERVQHWIVIDAGQTIEEVERQVWEVVEPFAKGLDAPLRTLWEGSFKDEA
jgi:thymidylate kinase